MYGIVLTAISQFFAEIATSMGKYETEHKRESLYAMGFLNGFWVTLFLVGLGFLNGGFVFAMESLPTVALRCALEVLLLFITLHAVIDADRSTFAFLRITTIPLLLGVDMLLGYAISLQQIFGIIAIVVAFILLLLNHGLSRKGKMLTLASAVIAVATISLYKYNITHFNSVEAEQIVMHVVLLVVLTFVAKYRTGENLFDYLKKPTFLSQSVISGFSGVFLSYAYVFAPASIITAAKRAFEIIGSMAAGRAVFHEKHLLVKIVALVLMSIGVGMVVF